MQALLSCLLFSALLVQVSALECYICVNQNNCTLETRTCNQNDTWCRAVVIQERSGNSTKLYFQKGCAWFDNRNLTTSQPTDRAHLVISEYSCTTDLCNRESPVIGPEWSEPNGLQCYTHACNFRDRSCNETNIRIQNCTGAENQCFDSYLWNMHGPEWSEPNGLQCYTPTCNFRDRSCNETNIRIQNCTGAENQCFDSCLWNMHGSYVPESLLKGCGHQPRLAVPFGLLTSQSLNLINSCNSSLCNNETIGEGEDWRAVQQRSLNGLKCFSCEGRSTGCSPQNQTIIECFGPLSLCIEIQVFSGDERFTYITRGCATPGYCQKYLKLGLPSRHQSQAYCCQGSLCNGQVANNTVMEEGTTKASIMSSTKSKTHKNGSALVEGNVQFFAALLVISAGWNLMMNPSF